MDASVGQLSLTSRSDIMFNIKNSIFYKKRGLSELTKSPRLIWIRYLSVVEEAVVSVLEVSEDSSPVTPSTMS